MSLTLLTSQGNFRSNKALIAAKFVGVQVDVQIVQMADTKTAAFLKVNPNGKVPALVTPQGAIFESHAIARYVARLRPDLGLAGQTFFEASQVDQWLDWAANELEPARAILVYTNKGYLQASAGSVEGATADVLKALAVLNDHLLHNTYLVGQRITLADIAVAVDLFDLLSSVLSAAQTKQYSNLLRWYNTIANQPQFVAVQGNATFKAEEKKEAPKAEKKEAAPAADLDDEEGPKKPKEKSPLELLPETPLVLDTTKKLAFSERPFKKDFFEELLKIWDAQGWSFWAASYNYNAENAVLFRTSNLVSGFLQRCDAVRKFAMGVMNITGNEDEETGPFLVHGAWLFRGLEVPKKEMLEENPDSEYYTWTKIDINTPEGLAKLKEEFMGDAINGQKCLERKFFK